MQVEDILASDNIEMLLTQMLCCKIPNIRYRLLIVKKIFLRTNL